MFKLSRRSKDRLVGVHIDLAAIVYHAIEITEIDFTVLEGVRTYERQRDLVENGASRTMRSRHLTGHAVDLGVWENGTVSWHWPHYDELSKWVKLAARDLQIPVQWGGDWVTFKDGPHWQLPVKQYPSRRWRGYTYRD